MMLFFILAKINPRFFTVKIQDRSCLGTMEKLYSEIVKNQCVWELTHDI